MKKRVGLFVVLLLVCVEVLLKGAPGQNRTIHVQFDYPLTEMTNVTSFNVYSNVNLSSPISSWPIMTNILATSSPVATNAGMFTFDFVLSPASKVTFLTITASNTIGESLPSPIVAVPYPPLAPPALRIQ